MVKVVFVCSGNICRSPTAEAVFRHKVAAAGLADAIEIDSAGTGHWHIGEPPDPRTREAAARRGFALDGMRARQITPEDFARFDHLVAMDSRNLRALQGLCPPQAEAKLSLFMSYTGDRRDRDVPDPYYGGPDGFERVLDMIEEGAAALLDHLRRNGL